MNKGFLSKKSWHTGSLRHVEKVWKAERANDEEQKKIEILKKEMAEEQQIYELKKLHQESTGRKSERLDWMYDGHIASGATKTSGEEYLLGKKYEGDKDQEDLSKLKGTVGSLFMGETNLAQDALTKIRDDPLLAIKREEQKSLQNILQNPVKMREIQKEKEMKALMKRVKKDKKKQEKKEKKRSKEEGRGSDAEADSPKRRKMEDGDRDRDRNERDDRDRDRNGRDNRDRDRDRVRDSDRDRRDGDDRRDRDRNDRDRDRNDRDRDRNDRDRDRNDRDRDRNDRDRDRNDRDRDRSDRDRNDRDRSDRDRSDRDRNERDRSDRDRDVKDEKIKIEPKTETGSASRPAWKRDNRRKPLDDEERKRRLQEMQSDAVAHEEDRWTRLKREKAEEAEENKQQHTAERTFIDDVNKGLYDTNAQTIEERMKRNVHYIQRRAVDDKFMKS